MGASVLNAAAAGHWSKREEADAVDTMLLKMERSPPRIDLGFMLLNDRPTLDRCWPSSDLEDVAVNDDPPSIAYCLVDLLSVAGVRREAAGGRPIMVAVAHRSC
ncbi:hypothetical protein ACLOJK_024192 [Asimina triloba]